MNWEPGWNALVITSLLAWVAALVGFYLYRHGDSVLKEKGLRFSGASAIAIVMYILMTRFFLSVSAQIDQQAQVDPEEVQAILEDFDSCIEQEGGKFQCKEPAVELRELCVQVLLEN